MTTRVRPEGRFYLVLPLPRLTRTRGGPTLSHGDPDPLERSVGAPFHHNRSLEHARAWGGFGIDILP